MNGVKIDKKNALALLSGILSDTVVLKSPTVTDEDVKAVHGLAHILDIDYIDYGKKMFEASSNLKGRSLESIITADFKIYEDYGLKIGVSQVETVNLNEINDIKYDLIDELKRIVEKENLNWAALLVTDIIEEKSILLTSGFKPIEDLIVYKKIEENVFILPGVLSRKKQLLPEILRVLEIISAK
jgi:manganese-dependent inorganic pyrophosphatase